MTYQSQSPEKELKRSRNREKGRLLTLYATREKCSCGRCKTQTSALPINTMDSKDVSVKAYKDVCFPNTHIHTLYHTHKQSDYQGQIMINHALSDCLPLH